MGWSSTGAQQQHAFVHDIIERELVRSIVGGFYEVDAYHGYGLSEAAYAGSMEIELLARGHQVARELAIEIEYKGQHVCWQRLDMVVDDKVIVEIKASEAMPPYAQRQLLNYLRASRFEIGLLLHFGPEATWKRFVDTRKRARGTR
jgi:GxxExxY protein